MPRRLLQVVGLLTLLGIGAASVGALLTIKEHVHLSIAGATEDRRAGPDPLALLQDDVAGLRRDLTALSQALAKNFDALAVADEGSEAEHRAALERAVAPLAAAVSRLSEGLAATRLDDDHRDATARTELASALADLRGRLQSLAAARPAAAAPAPPPAATSGPPTPAGGLPPGAGAAALPPPAVLGSPPAVPRASASAPPAASAAVPPPPDATASAGAAAPPSGRKRFLAFDLPSSGLDPDKATRFEIVPSLSRVGFDAKSTLHDFSGTTSEVAGTFVARLTQPGTGTTGSVRVLLAHLDTGLEERNAELATTLDARRFPAVELQLLSFAVTSVDVKSGGSSGTAQGRFVLHGVTREVAIPLRISLDESRRVVIEGEVPLRLTDYGVTPPKKLGVISVEDQIKVWVSLRARAAGRVP